MAQPRGFEDLPDIYTSRSPPENEEGNPPYDYFGEELQAAYLAGQTLQYVKSVDEPQESYFEDLNSQIMARLGGMFEKAPGSWRPFCNAIAILLM